MQDVCTRITLDVQKANMPLAVEAKRGDTGRMLLISLAEKGKPYPIGEDCTAVLTARKENGTKLREDCSVEAGMIRYSFSEQISMTPGMVTAEIKLCGPGGKLLTSASFLIRIHDAVFNEGDQAVTEEYVNDFVRLVTDTKALKEELERKLETGAFTGPAGEPGPRGEQGLQGEPGAPGKSAYDAAREAGYSGTEADFAEKMAAEYLPAAGGSLEGDLDMGGHRLTGLAEPESGTEAVTKDYADGKLLSRVILGAGRNLYNIRQAVASNSATTAMETDGSSIRVYSAAASGKNHSTKGNVFSLKANVAYIMSATIEKIEKGTVSFGFRTAKAQGSIGANGILKRLTFSEPGRYSILYTPTEDWSDVYGSLFVTGNTEGETGDATFSGIMVEEGDQPGTFEPYYRGLAELTAMWEELDEAYREGVNSV